MAGDGVSSEVSGAMARQSSVVLVVEVIRAATADPPDWIRVLELTGIDLTIDMACKVGLSWSGPLKTPLCSYGSYLTSLAKPLVQEILIAVVNRDWMRLIALLGPTSSVEIACQLLPEGEETKILCGSLGKVLAEVSEYASKAWNAASGAASDVGSVAWDAYDAGAELLGLSSPHMSYDEYYSRYFAQLVPKRTLQYNVMNRMDLGLEGDERLRCVDYFDDHQQKRDTAKKTCSDLNRRLVNDVNRFIDYVGAAPRSYFDAFMQPTLRDLVAENHGKNHLDQFLIHVNGLTPDRWGHASLPAGENPFVIEYRKCFPHMNNMLYGMDVDITVPGLVPPSNTEWACYQAARHYAAVLAGENIRLAAMDKKLHGAGCTPQQSAESSLFYRCTSMDAYLACSESFKGYRRSHCGIDRFAIEDELGEEIARTLRDARCTYQATQTSYQVAIPIRNPKVVCTREWKHAQCEQLLKQELKDPVLAGLGLQLGCALGVDPKYAQAKLEAQKILDALNAISPTQTPPAEPAISASPSAGSLTRHFALSRPKAALEERKGPARPTDIVRTELLKNCRPTWDPLALRCLDPSVVLRLGEKLPGTSLKPCRPDPLGFGAEAPCYAGALPITLPTPATPIEIPARPATPIEIPVRPSAPSSGTEPAPAADKPFQAPIRRLSPVEPAEPPLRPVPEPPPFLRIPRP
jgi:hypothetical protein